MHHAAVSTRARRGDAAVTGCGPRSSSWRRRSRSRSRRGARGSRSPSQRGSPKPQRGRANAEALAFALRPHGVPPPVRDAAASGGVRSTRRPGDASSVLFRSDLGEVRVHEGAASERAVRSVGADAFAVGPDVHLSHAAAEDERVLAHEVAHTVQARGARRVAPVLRADDAPLEREADRAARAVLSGDEAEISGDRRRRRAPLRQRGASPDRRGGGSRRAERHRRRYSECAELPHVRRPRADGRRSGTATTRSLRGTSPTSAPVEPRPPRTRTTMSRRSASRLASAAPGRTRCGATR